MGEATFLNTGFAVYGKEVLSRLHATGKYEVAELASYGSPNDPRRFEIPWTYYGNLPLTKQEEDEYKKQVENQWGLWRLEHVLLDFQPDVVVDIRDWWMLEFTQRSPFRRLFHWAIMPTIDSAPQRDQWLSTYMSADTVCAYSEFGRDTLIQALGDNVKFKGIAPPCAEYDIWKPVPDKKAHKEEFGFERDTRIVGTIMRNQKRKLLPDLIDAFKTFLIKNPSLGKDTFLYLHTGYPDIGWDIPKLLRESGISHKILFTYLCPRCTHVFPSFFHDSVQVCPKCHQPTAVMPGPDAPLPTQKLAKVVNCFDVYVQYSTCEGFGMPQLEAAACGVPVMAVNYSAMESILKNINGIPIDVERFFLECETHAYRAYPDNNQLADKLAKFFSKPEHIRQQIGKETYLACRQNYNWDKTAKIWDNIFTDIIPINGWNSPPRIIEPATSMPVGMTNEDFVRWAIRNVWGEPSYDNSYIALRMVRDLNYKQAITGNGGIFHSDDSILAQAKYRPFTREMVIAELTKLAMVRNEWEARRAKAGKVSVPAFITMKKGVVK